jgi:NTE family protein
VRLNTPIKPALALGAEKIVVIGLDSIAERPAGMIPGHEPDVIEGLQQFLGAAFVQPLLADMATLAGLNPQSPGADAGKVPYIFVGPAKPEAVGAVAAAVWAEHYGALRHLLSRKRRDLAFLGRAVAAPVDAQHGDLASYLFFCREFAEELLAMGARDAQAWFDGSHDDGPWDWGANLD